MDSACRNQQGNCDEVEDSARPFLLIFLALWLNLCNNSDQTWFCNALTFSRSLGSCSASVFNISLGTWQTLMHGKPCLIPIMRLLHEHAIFQTVKSKVIISLIATVRLSVSISLRNLYNSLNSIKEMILYQYHKTGVLWPLL